MQRRLINHLAGQQRIAVLFQQDGQPVEPFFPLLTQIALDAYVLDHGAVAFIPLVAFVRRMLTVHDKLYSPKLPF